MHIVSESHNRKGFVWLAIVSLWWALRKLAIFLHFRNSVCTCCTTPCVQSRSPGSSNHKPVRRDIPYRNSDNILLGRVDFDFPVRILLAQQNSDSLKRKIEQKLCADWPNKASTQLSKAVVYGKWGKLLSYCNLLEGVHKVVTASVREAEHTSGPSRRYDSLGRDPFIVDYRTCLLTDPFLVLVISVFYFNNNLINFNLIIPLVAILFKIKLCYNIRK